MNVSGFELPVVYKYHCLVCCQDRPPNHPRGSCGSAGARPLWEHLSVRLERMQDPRVSLNTTGCMGFCSAGPLMVIYPEGVWYQPKSKDDIDLIVDSHLTRGTPVAELIVVLKR